MDGVYVCWEGLVTAASEAKGNEHISIGIRPYGFHAGNELTLYIYPWHFCNLVKQLGKKVEFTFFISLNDMEPEGLKYLYYSEKDGYFYKTEELTLTEEVPFEFNMFVKETSFEYTPDKHGCCKSTAEHWGKVIQEKVLRLKEDFPDLKFNFIRSSELKNNPYYKKAIDLGINHPEVLGKIASQYDTICLEKGWLSWTGAICPQCHSGQGTTTLDNELVTFTCTRCKNKSITEMEKTSFWMNHMLLLAPRLKILQIDIFFRGYDHYACNHIPINEKLYHELFHEVLHIKTIVPPLIVRSDGKKMGKTWSNEKSIDTQLLKDLASQTKGDKIIL